MPLLLIQIGQIFKAGRTGGYGKFIKYELLHTKKNEWVETVILSIYSHADSYDSGVFMQYMYLYFVKGNKQNLNVFEKCQLASVVREYQLSYWCD